MSSEPPHISDDQQAQAHLRSWDARARKVRAQAQGGAMVWRCWGEGPAVVFLHGGSGSWNHWIRNIPFFAARARVIAGDLPGLGDSPSPPEPYTAESLAALVSECIDQVVPAGEAFDLVGFSFGGIVGGHVASLQAGRMRSVTVVGSPPFGMGPTGPANEVVPVSPDLGFEEARSTHVHNLELFMIADRSRVDPLAIRAHFENLRRARLRSRKIARTDTLARALRRAPCIRRGIWGSEDVTAHPDLPSIEALFREFDAQGSFDVLPGAGHWAAYEDHARFNQLLLDHLSPA